MEASGVISPFEFLDVKAVNFVCADAYSGSALKVDLSMTTKPIN